MFGTLLAKLSGRHEQGSDFAPDMTIAHADITQRTAGLYAGGGRAAEQAKTPAAAKEAAPFQEVLSNRQRQDTVRMAGSTVQVRNTSAADKDDSSEGGGFIGFIKAVLDVINPLQHLPVISTIYRHITGDEISPAARIAGGALFGGPVGLAMGVVNAAVVSNTGKDVGQTVLAMAFDGDKQKMPPVPQTQTAAPVMIAAADIIWNTPDTAVPQKNSQPDKNSDQHGTMLAMADRQEILSAVTPTHLRTRRERIDEPVTSLPYAPPVHTTKKGMLAPTESMQVVSGAGLTAAPDAVGERTPAHHPAETVVATTAVPGFLNPGASPVLQLQNAPVDDARRASLPEQIALADKTAKTPTAKDKDGSLGLVAPVVDRGLIPLRMAEALEKYAVMKRAENASAQRGLVSVQY